MRSTTARYEAGSEKIYAFNWGIGVVEAFRDRYPRGWANLVVLANNQHRDVFVRAVTLVRGNQQYWEVFKRVVKELDLSPPPPLTNRADRKKYLTFVKYIAEDAWLDALIEAAEASQG